MVARLDPAPAPGWPHRLQLGSWQAGADPFEAVLHALGADPPRALGAGVRASGLCSAANCKQMAQRLQQAGLHLEAVSSCEPSTPGGLAALGLVAARPMRT